MSNYCVCCGSPIPNGQNGCSMCYGDLDYGGDGYYRQAMERAALFVVQGGDNDDP